MTSGISFFKFTLNEWKKLGWLTAVQTLVFVLAVPFWLLLNLALKKNTGKKVLEDVLYANVGFEKTGCTILIVLAGIFCAIAVFGYLHFRERLDFYYSLAIRRETLFLAKFTAGALTFAAAYLASQALAIFAGAFYGVMSAAVVQEIVVASMMGILFFLTSYSAAALAVLLTGKTLTSVLAVVALAGYLPLLWLIVSGYQDLFLPTLLSGRTWGSKALWLPGIFRNYGLTRGELLRYSSPWTLILSWRTSSASVRQGLTGMWPDLDSICMFLVLPAATTALDLALCRVRRTEAAGRALAFGWMEGLIKVMLAVPTALLVGMNCYNEFGSPSWEICFVVLFGVLACVIMEFIYRWDIRRVLAHKWHIVVTVAISLTVFLLFRFDLAGINSWLPNREDLAAVSMRDTYGNFNYYDGDGRWLEDEGEILRLLETDRIDLIYPLAENGVQNWKKRYLDGSFRQVNIEYRLKSGKTILRSYNVDYDMYRAAMQELMKDEAYRERYYPILSWEEEKLEQVNNVWAILPEKLRKGGEEQESQKGMEPDSATGPTDGERTGISEEEADGPASATESTGGLAPGVEIAAADAEDYDAGAGMEYSSDAMVGLTLSREESIRLIRAYQEDLAQSDGLLLDSIGALSIDWRNRREDSFLDQYPLCSNFTRTIKILQEAAATDDTETQEAQRQTHFLAISASVLLSKNWLII